MRWQQSARQLPHIVNGFMTCAKKATMCSTSPRRTKAVLANEQRYVARSKLPLARICTS